MKAEKRLKMKQKRRVRRRMIEKNRRKERKKKTEKLKRRITLLKGDAWHIAKAQSTGQKRSR
jgi:hypothetical protein